jgi:DNA-binding CsgD family transcriptional regulator
MSVVRGRGAPHTCLVSDGFIRSERALAAARILGEVSEIGPRTQAGREHLVAEMLRLLGGAVGGLVQDDNYALGGRSGIVEATLVGFDRETQNVFQTHHTRGSDFNPFHRAMMIRDLEPGRVVTTTHEQVVLQTDWRRSEWINEYCRPARVDFFVCSIRKTGTRSGVGLGFMRGTADRPFSEEDRDLLHLVHVGLGGPLYEAKSPRAELAPRVRDTLDELLTGAGDKEIAARLAISHHTVRQYVKVILRAYGLHSRAQLIAKFGRRMR